MSSPLYCAGDAGWLYFFTQDSETLAQTEFKNLELRLPRGEDRVEQYYENLAALRQLLHDEYGSSDSDGQMFEVVGVPDDCSNADPAEDEVIVLLNTDNPPLAGRAILDAVRQFQVVKLK